jgi:hypothetical protein
MINRAQSSFRVSISSTSPAAFVSWLDTPRVIVIMWSFGNGNGEWSQRDSEQVVLISQANRKSLVD